ncbi:heavy-metal-associated domain-containing protein [Fulvimarina sp. 2208YS6-2-32]|uniref:Heavy-metal-associated domain-containing protein n=1 Tax=Fulvimarina uroteuthidis TaxID=3098149 RepID=A0ABU5I4C1_9HYPH|nr:heavy-metal-associated domain-containing protein [Fulvimarina sp. 2208YS6-2-32]MDY8110235.1 heavy-metal-associated domain-containing protein [Fulvimarina sp. 2208YS6-2-32]
MLAIGGMHCGGCAATIEKALIAVPGVTAVHADPASKTAKVEGRAAPTDLFSAVKAAGYQASIAAAPPKPQQDTFSGSTCCRRRQP